MSLIPYNPSSLGIGGKSLTIAKASSSNLPAAVAYTATDSGDLFTVTSAHNLKTGDKLSITVSTGTTGVTTGTYYAIVQSSTTFKVATTAALALAGTAVAISADGTGTITYSGQTYRAMNWAPEKSAKVIERNDETGADAEFSLLAGATRQTGLQLQLATASSSVPRVGMEFADPDDSTITYVVTATGGKYSSGEIWMCEISYRSTSNFSD